MPLSVLIIEDDVSIRDPLCDLLNFEGFATSGVGSIKSFNAWRKAHECDVLIVDRMLPDGDGLYAAQVFKSTTHGRVIVVSGKADLDHRLEGIQADVDYYLAKPVEIAEVTALLRQYESRLVADGEAGWVFDTRRWQLINPDGVSVALTQSETRVISCFVESAGISQSKDELVEALGKSPEDYDPRRLEILIRRLRNKVKEKGTELPLVTVYGGGFCFTENLRKI